MRALFPVAVRRWMGILRQLRDRTSDGTPKLTCGTFLSDYAPGPVLGGAADQLPDRP